MTDSALQLLLDEREIVALAAKYCWSLDTRRWDDLDDVFLPDATAQLGPGEPLIGAEAIKTFIARSLGVLDGSQHLIGTHQVQVDGDTATHRCHLHAQHIRDQSDMSKNFVVAGPYEDDLVRTAAGWRIKHRTLTFQWTFGLG